jgi:hypothetical protein
MRSPSVTRNETRRPARKLQDKASGLGYNRDLIGAAQALRFDSAPAVESQLLSPSA